MKKSWGDANEIIHYFTDLIFSDNPAEYNQLAIPTDSNSKTTFEQQVNNEFKQQKITRAPDQLAIALDPTDKTPRPLTLNVNGAPYRLAKAVCYPNGTHYTELLSYRNGAKNIIYNQFDDRAENPTPGILSSKKDGTISVENFTKYAQDSTHLLYVRESLDTKKKIETTTSNASPSTPSGNAEQATDPNKSTSSSATPKPAIDSTEKAIPSKETRFGSITVTKCEDTPAEIGNFKLIDMSNNQSKSRVQNFLRHSDQTFLMQELTAATQNKVPKIAIRSMNEKQTLEIEQTIKNYNKFATSGRQPFKIQEIKILLPSAQTIGATATTQTAAATAAATTTATTKTSKGKLFRTIQLKDLKEEPKFETLALNAAKGAAGAMVNGAKALGSTLANTFKAKSSTITTPAIPSSTPSPASLDRNIKLLLQTVPSAENLPPVQNDTYRTDVVDVDISPQSDENDIFRELENIFLNNAPDRIFEPANLEKKTKIELVIQSDLSKGIGEKLISKALQRIIKEMPANCRSKLNEIQVIIVPKIEKLETDFKLPLAHQKGTLPESVNLTIEKHPSRETLPSNVTLRKLDKTLINFTQPSKPTPALIAQFDTQLQAAANTGTAVGFVPFTLNSSVSRNDLKDLFENLLKAMPDKLKTYAINNGIYLAILPPDADD